MRWLLMLALVSTSFASDDAPLRPSPTNPATVHVVAYRSLPGGKAAGVASEMRVWVGPTEPDRVRVGFFESEVAGTGNQWRAAGWTAALAASMLLDFDPRTSRVAFDVEGRIDGPSAGGLMTVAVMAAVRGDRVRPDATMTGTINPDGKIGPVGGIAQKIEAAARIGKKRVLIPDGLRFHFDPNLDKRVDLVAKGRELGVEVLPVVDVWSAYSLLTDARLPRAEAARPPAASPEFSRQISGLIDTWLREQLQPRKTDYDALPERYRPQEVQALLDETTKYVRYAEGLRNEGRFSAAFADVSYAVGKLATALETARCLQVFEKDGLEGVVARAADSDWLKKDVDDALAQYRGFRPKTINQLAMYLESIDYLNQGLSYQAYANVFQNLMPKDDDQRRAALALKACIYQRLATLNLVGARHLLGLAASYEGPPLADDAPVRWMADYFLRATDANGRMLAETVVKQRAAAMGIPQSEVELRMVEIDEDLAALNLTRNVILPQLAAVFGEGQALEYGRLGMAMNMYARSTFLVARYYSLDVQLDEHGAVTGVGRERSFGDWLTMSEEQTRRSIGELVARGIDPTVCVQLYGMARVSQGRDLQERLFALGTYLRANVIARVLKRMAPE